MQQVKYKFGRSRSTDHSAASRFDPTRGPESGAVFAFTEGRPSNSVTVENIPDHVNRRELVCLFSTLIGEVRSFQDIKDGPTSRLDVTFLDTDAATKALCMNGYTVGGVALSVSALTVASPVPRPNKSSTDDRRNLYVLGLPFALTKNEFTSLFSQYGTVSHCVILATVDNSSRRRGFVVMSSHEEAKLALSTLTRTQIKGHTIDISWAVVQRSQGFLDGGDRALLLDSRSHMPTPSPKLHDRKSLSSSDTSDSSLGSNEADPSSLAPCSVPTPSLLVSNLPTILFSQAQDLHPLFFPFGQIEKLEIVQVSPLGTMSVIVQYSTPCAAQEAKDSLNGQHYGNSQIEARFVMPCNSMALYIGRTPSIDGPTGTSGTASVYPPLDYFSKPHASGERMGSIGGHFAKGSLTPCYGAGTHALGLSTPTHYNMFANPQSRQSPLSAIRPTFSNVFCDSQPSSAISRWSTERAYSLPIPDQRRQYSARSSPMALNGAYQSSIA